jgi:MOSC domain-containing protein YiiM
MKTIHDLQQQFPAEGTVAFISVRPRRREDVIALNEVNAITNVGLDGDRYRNKSGSRQVTLIQSEHLEAVSSFLGKTIRPEDMRRNIVVKGINLLSLKGQTFRIGMATLQYSGECHPCSRMEESLGTGGYNAMRGHGGITAKVVEGGLIRLGDKVTVIFPLNY